MKKVYIATAHKGFNYGTSLQAYAIKQAIKNLGYEPEIVWSKEGVIKGRDIRLKKILVMLSRTIWRPNLFKKTFLTYKKSLKKDISDKEKKLFLDFEEKMLDVHHYSWKELKNNASSHEVLACICGSDQIWNATNLYIDPMYYLKFAPLEKRIAYAPSFGKDSLPSYNVKKIKENIEEITYLSVREDQGATIIKDLTNREASVVLDPTLLLNKEQWMELLDTTNPNSNYSNDYILLYFLDNPSKMAVDYIKELLQESDYQVVIVPQLHEEFKDLKNIIMDDVGPLEFINLVMGAKYVFTDSFHGTIFSINYNVPFLTFKREYGTAKDQSSRLTSILSRLKLSNRFISEDKSYELNEILTMSFEEANYYLEKHRNQSKKYLIDSLRNI